MDRKSKPKIKFVSYTGKYPCLCMGVLTLNIDGENKTFGTSYEYDYNRFWDSGGYIRFDENWNEDVGHGRWIINKDYLPDFLAPYSEVLDNIFNEHVLYGCCGGCV